MAMATFKVGLFFRGNATTLTPGHTYRLGLVDKNPVDFVLYGIEDSALIGRLANGHEIVRINAADITFADIDGRRFEDRA